MNKPVVYLFNTLLFYLTSTINIYKTKCTIHNTVIYIGCFMITDNLIIRCLHHVSICRHTLKKNTRLQIKLESQSRCHPDDIELKQINEFVRSLSPSISHSHSLTHSHSLCCFHSESLFNNNVLCLRLKEVNRRLWGNYITFKM